MAWRWFLVAQFNRLILNVRPDTIEDYWAFHHTHKFEPTFYFMWVWTIAFLGIMAYVAVKHL